MIGLNHNALVEANRLEAFKHYVEAWKKQDPQTVKLENGVYSYKTKRGTEKKYQAIKEKDASKYHGLIKVNTFLFTEIE
jgi:hypothetical protein